MKRIKIAAMHRKKLLVNTAGLHTKWMMLEMLLRCCLAYFGRRAIVALFVAPQCCSALNLFHQRRVTYPRVRLERNVIDYLFIHCLVLACWSWMRVAEDRARWRDIGEAYVQQWTVIGWCWWWWWLVLSTECQAVHNCKKISN
jgi:hypothetical protein